ncbi:CynX/NimT family MFS transporter [Arthrobacter ginkgonis]|uniref:CynX/NimT family MFS transporter n=1 Tax=Arthrobacter ginkgonis TaxID=1630594 RepID=A0ABP7CJS2_9MICC
MTSAAPAQPQCPQTLDVPRPVIAAPPAPASARWVRALLAVAAVVLVGLNLRAAIASAAPLYHGLQDLLGYGPLVASLLPTIPVLCFGFAGAATAWLVRRAGLERAIALALVLLTAGLAARAVESTAMLLAGTVAAMCGLAVCNVAMPSFIREHHARRTPVMTGTYTITMSVGATLAATVSVPIAAELGSASLGLAAWALPAVVALVAFLPLALRRRAGGRAAGRHVSPWPMLATRKGLLFTSLFAVQALLAYTIMGWLPSILIARGLDATAAGLILGLVQVVTIPAVVLLLWMAARPRLVRPAFMVVGVSSLTGFTALLFVPAQWAVVPAVLMGIGFGIFPLVMLLISRSGETAAETTALSTLAQSLGYLIAAAGPFGLGLLHDALGSWTVPLALLAACAVVQLLLAYWLSKRPAGVPATVRTGERA